MRALTVSLVLLLALSAAAAAPDIPYHFLKVEGKARFLELVTLNGTKALGGTIVSLSYPYYITKYLKDGQNTMTIVYTSDSDEGLAVVIEQRKPGWRRTELVRFTSVAGFTAGQKAEKTVSFQASVVPLLSVVLSDADVQAIRRVLQTYIDALIRRDFTTLTRLYDAAIKEGNEVYPEGVGFFKESVASVGEMLVHPEFRVVSYGLNGLQLLVDGQVILASRTDGSPIVESNQVEIEKEIFVVRDGREVREKTKVRTKLTAKTVYLKKLDGVWQFALPFGF